MPAWFFNRRGEFPHACPGARCAVCHWLEHHVEDWARRLRGMALRGICDAEATTD